MLRNYNLIMKLVPKDSKTVGVIDLFYLEKCKIYTNQSIFHDKYLSRAVHSNRQHFIGTMAQSWRGGIGKYPPIPERFGNTSRCPEAKPREEGGISRPRRMRWVFSNPTEPWLCHCHCNSEKNKYCQEVYIDQWKPLDNSKFFPIVKRFTLINVNLLKYLFFSLLQWQWHSHGSGGLEKTHLILRCWNYGNCQICIDLW